MRWVFTIPHALDEEGNPIEVDVKPIVVEEEGRMLLQRHKATTAAAQKIAPNGTIHDADAFRPSTPDFIERMDNIISHAAAKNEH